MPRPSRLAGTALDARSPLHLAKVVPTPLAIASTSSDAWRQYLLLGAATLCCLLPFSAKAFHVDDTLFVLAGKHIVHHPLDPYGFEVVWNVTPERMAEVTKNPPLTCYYVALAGIVGGWSERAVHLAFLLPAVGLVLGTYRLAQRFTRFPLLAALATFLTPGVLVSATSVMCDVMMVALWIWATVFWIEGLDAGRPSLLAVSSALLAAGALTKYFGAALIPLLLVYSLIRLRRVGWWAVYLLLPIVALLGYELWTTNLYGQGLVADAAEFASAQRSHQGSALAHVLISLSFSGGCAITVLMLTPLLWSRRQIAVTFFASTLAAISICFNWINYGVRANGESAALALQEHWLSTVLQLTFCIASGLFILAVALSHFRNRNNADSWLLTLWVVGTWFFAGFLNWTINARSVLPLIPAASILMFRRIEMRSQTLNARQLALGCAFALTIAGLLSLWITTSDVALANSAKEAASVLQQRTQGGYGKMFFLGHWGFQYYMQELGFIPAGQDDPAPRIGDLVAIPMNNTQLAPPPHQLAFVAQQNLEFLSESHVTTISSVLGAGFYSSYWGPLPFAFGKVPPETYYIGQVVPLSQVPTARHEQTSAYSK